MTSPMKSLDPLVAAQQSILGLGNVLHEDDLHKADITIQRAQALALISIAESLKVLATAELNKPKIARDR